MLKIFFQFKLDSVELQFIDTNLSVSLPFNQSEIEEQLVQKLAELKFVPDLNSLNYYTKDDKLFVEGVAHEEQEKFVPEYFIF
jgi:hypothetical protein